MRGAAAKPHGQPRRRGLMSQLPFFSVIVPTYDRPRQLTACLRSLTALDYPRDRFEVIVVDDGSAPSVIGAMAAAGNVIDLSIVRQRNAGPGAARNAGAARARGTFLAFTADDCTPAGGWLRTFAAYLATAPDTALGGRIRNTEKGNVYSAATHLLIEHLYSYYNVSSTNAAFFTPNNLSVPARLFRDIGGFDASFVMGAGEDREFCGRWRDHGYRMAYIPEAVVYHAHPLTLSDFCRLHFRYGRGTFRYRRMRAQRRSARIRLEPLRFYWDLLRSPVARPDISAPVTQAALLGLAQVANAAGFFWEAALSRIKPRERSSTVLAGVRRETD